MSNLTTAAYLISSVLFILSLRGLSHPSTARRGNFLGIIGMTIAIVTTLANPGVLSYKEIGIAFLIGGLIGTSILHRINAKQKELVTTFAYDVNSKHRDIVSEMKIATFVYYKIDDAIKDADLVILSVPVGSMKSISISISSVSLSLMALAGII